MTNQIIDQIKHLAENNRSKFIEMRHHLHANPELSFEEFETSKFVKNHLLKKEQGELDKEIKEHQVDIKEGKFMVLNLEIYLLKFQYNHHLNPYENKDHYK